MDSFMILLVFVSLAQGVYVPTLKADYGLSKKQAAVLHKILLSQELTITTFFAALDEFFGIFLDVEAETDELDSKIAEVLVQEKSGVKILTDLDVLIMGNSCSAAVEVARMAADAKFEDVFAMRIRAALKSAGSGNYSRNRAAIDMQHAAARKDYENLIEIDYGVINTCLNITDDDTRAVIESARKKSLVIAVHIINAAFNAIKIYSAAVPVKCGDSTFTLDIQDLKEKILESTLTYVKYKFSTLRTLYINSCLNQRGIVSGVASSQYTEIVSFLEYKKGNEGIFGIATSYLKRIDLGLFVDSDGSAFSATNVSLARVTAVYDVGDDIILDFILFMHPDTSARIAEARKYLHALNVEGNIAFVNAFDAAVAPDRNHFETLDFIQTLKNEIVSAAPNYTQYIFDLIRNNRTFDRETEAELTTLQNVTLYGAVINNYKFFDAAIILANASYTGSLSTKDYCAIQVLLDEANQALDGFTQGITAAGLLVYRIITAG